MAKADTDAAGHGVGIVPEAADGGGSDEVWALEQLEHVAHYVDWKLGPIWSWSFHRRCSNLELYDKAATLSVLACSAYKSFPHQFDQGKNWIWMYLIEEQESTRHTIPGTVDLNPALIQHRRILFLASYTGR
jgi:hypothetical protein